MNLEQELFGNPQKGPFKKIVLPTLILFALAYLAYYAFIFYQDLNYKFEPLDESDKQFKERYTHIKNALLSNRADITDEMLRQGFWYTYTDENGVEYFAFFDASKLSKLNLSDWQLKQILNRVKKAEKLKKKQKVRVLSDDELDDAYKFHNYIYSNPLETNYLGIKEALENKYQTNTFTKEDLFKLAYIYDLEGDYSKRNELYAVMCRKYNERCRNELRTITVSGVVQDIEGNPLAGVKVYPVSYKNQVGYTDKDGKYSLQIKADKLEKLRILAEKQGYSDGVASLIVLTDTRKKYDMDKIIMSKADTHESVIDTRTNKVINGDAQFNDPYFIVSVNGSVFYIPKNSIKDKTGKPYRGKVKVYAVYYDRTNVPGSLMRADMFDGALGYSGNVMYTFGMPYVKLFAENGQELFLFKDNPAIVRYKMQNLQELFNRKIITPKDLQAMITLSQNSKGYPINRKYILENDLLGFSTFWVFERNRGVWIEVGKKVLNTDGLCEAVFYHLSK